jgi:hypothetical protein
MMPKISLQEMVRELEQQLPRLEQLLSESLDFASLEQLLSESLDFASLERAVNGALSHIGGYVLGQLLESVLSAPTMLSRLQREGARRGLKLKTRARSVRLRFGQGQHIEVEVPYFAKTQPKGGRMKRRGRAVCGSYLGLEALGFLKRCSPALVSEAVELALLSPSFAVAHGVLQRRGVELDVKTLRGLCAALGEAGLAERGSVSLAGDEQLSGRTLVIGIDGGRLRERRPKRGRRAAGLKRQGYHSDWKEPKLLTIYAQTHEGKIDPEFTPLHDATLGDHEALFALLQRYLHALPLEEVERIVFCGDGASWIWNGVEKLRTQGVLSKEKVWQVLDYTHAKQNLHALFELVPASRCDEALRLRWREWLWQGEQAALKKDIVRVITTRKRRKQALRKWQNYFVDNAQRMRYRRFADAGLPCGSGHVESAIRRVINLRLKAPGTFWTRKMGECFLFLRSQLISGRWQPMLDNVTRRTANALLFQSDRPNITAAHQTLLAAA